MPDLFDPLNLGALRMANRIVMAPMTRDRAGPGDVPTPLMADYYRQRASAGLIVTEGVQPNAAGKGYWRTPGIYTADQIAGWRTVTDAVHTAGGRIVMQLMHCGRVVVAANRGYEAPIVAPSAERCPALVPGPDGVPVATEAPMALTGEGIADVIADHAQAARNAIAAGCDGVELHCASGYLVNQFLNPVSNRRNDDWGGSADNRIRAPIAILQAMADAIGADRVGFRISPGNPYNGMDVTDPAATFVPFVTAASAIGLAYCHVVDMALADLDTLGLIKTNWAGPIIANSGLKLASAQALIAAGRADAVSFGRAWIANPDLVARLRNGVPLTRVDFDHVYTGEATGYTDYPTRDGGAPGDPTEQAAR